MVPWRKVSKGEVCCEFYRLARRGVLNEVEVVVNIPIAGTKLVGSCAAAGGFRCSALCNTRNTRHWRVVQFYAMPRRRSALGMLEIDWPVRCLPK